MPIQKHLYPADWKQISFQVRSAAGWCCEDCGAPHLQVIRRTGRPVEQGAYLVDWIRVDEIEETGKGIVPTRTLSARRLKFHGLTKVVITTAHLDRDPGNNEPENLRAKCQRCHLGYDMSQNQRIKDYGRGHNEQPKLFNTTNYTHE